MSLAEVSNILRRERNVLEQLLFKLTEEQRWLEAGDVWALAVATHEVDEALGEVGHTELLRAIEVQLVADELGLSDGSSLRQLAEAAPSPWSTILRSHYEELRSLTAEITRLARANRMRRSHADAVLDAIEPLRRDVEWDAPNTSAGVCPSLVDFLK